MTGALSTDLYQLTMMAGYVQSGLTGPATFELFVRRLPPHRKYLLCAGLAEAIEYLEGLRFGADDIAYLRTVPDLRETEASFFDEYLPNFRFTGDVYAMPEGTVAFDDEPLVQVTASLPEAQLIETALLAIVSFQTSVASRTSRVVRAAEGRPVIEFGARRAHGPESGAFAARAAYLAGCVATSNLEAGRRWKIPVSGTMAHSWVLAHASEEEAFASFAALYGDRAVLLIDTYDTVAAVDRIIAAGLRPAAVRLDSGDLASLATAVRARLDRAGLRDTQLFGSGDLDEHRIRELVRSGTPFDGFGVGSAISAVTDLPSLSAARGDSARRRLVPGDEAQFREGDAPGAQASVAEAGRIERERRPHRPAGGTAAPARAPAARPRDEAGSPLRESRDAGTGARPRTGERLGNASGCCGDRR